MAVFLTGDMHGMDDIAKIERFSEVARQAANSPTTGGGKSPYKLGRNDFLIILGDFGLVWRDPPAPEEARGLDWLEAQPWTTLFIDGNHENFHMLGEFPTRDWHGGRVHVVRPHILHLMRGETFEIGGHSFFAAGGAHSIDEDWRTPGRSWWPEEVPDERERERIEARAREVGRVDYVLTHCPPTGQYERYKRLFPKFWGPSDEYTDWLEEHLEGVLSYRRWFYGHIHLDFPLDEPHTCLYNVVFDLDNTGLVPFATDMGCCPDGHPHEYEYHFEMPKPADGSRRAWRQAREEGGRVYYRCSRCGKELDMPINRD